MALKDSIIAERYAKALFQTLEEKKAFTAVLKDLAHLAAQLAARPDLAAFINTPILARKQAASLMRDLAMTAEYHEITVSFLDLLAQNARLDLFADITKSLKDLIARQKKQVSGVVISAQKLNKTQLSTLQADLKAKSGYDISLENQIDPAILGGLIVKVASYFIDSSLKTKLVRLNTHLKGLLDETPSV